VGASGLSASGSGSTFRDDPDDRPQPQILPEDVKVENASVIPEWQTEIESPPPHLTGVELSGDQPSTHGQVFVCRDVEDAMGQAASLIEAESGGEEREGELVVVSGSLYLVADALRYQEKLEGRTVEDS